MVGLVELEILVGRVGGGEWVEWGLVIIVFGVMH